MSFSKLDQKVQTNTFAEYIVLGHFKFILSRRHLQTNTEYLLLTDLLVFITTFSQHFSKNQPNNTKQFLKLKQLQYNYTTFCINLFYLSSWIPIWSIHERASMASCFASFLFQKLNVDNAICNPRIASIWFFRPMETFSIFSLVTNLVVYTPWSDNLFLETPVQGYKAFNLW